MTKKGSSQGASVASGTPPAGMGFSLISGEKLTQLYAAMVKCRMLDERVRILRKEKKISGKIASAAGREAVQVGVAIDLLAGDFVSASQRDMTVNFIKCVPLEKIFRSLFAPASSKLNARKTSAQVCNEPLNVMAASSATTAQIGIAAGVALANKMQKNGKLAVAFLDETAASQESCDELLRYASAHRLPLVLVFQNSRGDEEIALKAQSHGIPVLPVDRDDVVAIYRVACEAFTHARKGNGPTLIECKPYCLEGQKKPRKAGDPILNMRRYLTGKGLFREEFKGKIAAGFSKELDAAVAAAKRSCRKV